MDLSGSGIDDHLRWIRNLHQLCGQVDLRSFEEAPRERIETRLVPLTRSELEIARRVFDELSTQYEGVRVPSGAVEEGVRNPSQEIADLCFIAKMELRPLEDELDKLRDQEDKWSLLASAARVLGSIAKAIYAMEPQLCQLADEDPLLGRDQPVELSVRVRRVYNNFHQQVTFDGEPTPASILGRLRAVREATLRLVAAPVYPQLRGSDRCSLRRLQERVQAWLDEGDDAAPSAGLDLWKDLSALSEMFQQINRRMDLIEHDQKLIVEALERLEALPGGATLPLDLRSRLQSMIGRDPELDALVADEDPPAASRVAEVLERVQGELSPSNSQPIPVAAHAR